MKIYLIILLSLITTFNIFAQNPGPRNALNARGEILSLAMLEIRDKMMFGDNSQEINLNEIKGSPYLENEFVSGFVYNDSKKEYYGFQLRYNVYYDEIEVINVKDDSVSALLKSPNYSCTMRNLNFKYLHFNDSNTVEEDGYFIELNKGRTKLLLKYNCKYSPKEPNINPIKPSKPASFKISKKYYILKDDTLILLPTKKKKVLALFGKYDNEVSSYINKNKLNVKEERDITRIITYYNSIEK